MPVTYTEIDRRQVPVLDGPRTVVYFSVGCNPHDHVGNYEFWTVGNSTANFYGRWPEGKDDPGARAREMEGKPDYKPYWAIAKTATLVEPTSAFDLIKWLNDRNHAKDAPCAKHATIHGQHLAVVKRNGRYDLEASS
jgi:hypothetical protein